MHNPQLLIISAEVRYWEDAEINGTPDTEDGDRIPLKVGDLWKPTIHLESGRVLDWPEGTTARIHYKVCDQGEYWIEDIEGTRFKYKGDYVPEILGVTSPGCGDYIILDIGADGFIAGWKRPVMNPNEWIRVPGTGGPSDSEIVDYLASLWRGRNTGHPGHHLMGKWFPDHDGTFRGAIRAAMKAQP